jgi:hypothetical protein
MFGVVYNPTFAGRGVREGMGERERVKESCVVRTVSKCEGNLAGGRGEWEIKEGGINEQKINQRM